MDACAGSADTTFRSRCADIPMGARAQNVLSYTQDRLTPVVEQVKSFVLKKKDEAADEKAAAG